MLQLALTVWDSIETSLLALGLIAAVVLRVIAWRNFDWGGDVWSGGLMGESFFATGRDRSTSRPRPRLRQQGPGPGPAQGQVERQLLNSSTGEITTRDLGDEDLPPTPAAAVPSRPLSEEEELELIRERRWRIRQRLPEISTGMHAQWMALAAGLRSLPPAALAVPGNWQPPRAANGAAGMTEPQWAQEAAGPHLVGETELAEHEIIDRNRNGIPDHLELERGQRWHPLSYAERAWRSVLEAEQGPAVLVTGLTDTMNELYLAQALMGYPLRLQGPLEEARGMVLRAFAGCDERVEPGRREEMRQAVLVFIDRDLPRMEANLARAAAECDAP